MGSPAPAMCYRENWFPIVGDLFSLPLAPSSSSGAVGGPVAPHPAGMAFIWRVACALSNGPVSSEGSGSPFLAWG